MSTTMRGSSFSWSGGATMSPNGSAPLIAVQAAANFDGRGGGVITSHNVTSITRESTGKYAVSFVRNLPYLNSCVNASCKIDTTNADGNSWVTGVYRIPNNPYYSYVYIGCYYPGGGNVDADQVHFIAHST